MALFQSGVITDACRRSAYMRRRNDEQTGSRKVICSFNRRGTGSVTQCFYRLGTNDFLGRLSRVGAQGNLRSNRPYRKRIARRDDAAGTFQRRFRNRLQLQSGTRGPGAPGHVSRSLFPGWTGVLRCVRLLWNGPSCHWPRHQGDRCLRPRASGGDRALDRHPRGTEPTRDGGDQCQHSPPRGRPKRWAEFCGL